MSLILIVPEDGSLEQQPMQYLEVKKGSNVEATMKFYKDRMKIYPWNLAAPVQFNVRAKKLKSLDTWVFNKDKNSADVDLTDADDGEVLVTLNSTNTTAHITGDVSIFTGIAGDKLKVTIDDIEYDDINISACTTVAMVVAAINAAVGRVVASLTPIEGYLVVTSLISGDLSNVAITDGTNSTQTVVGDLFAATPTTDTGVYGDLSIAQSLYVEVEFQPNASLRVYKTADIVLNVVETVE